MVVTIACRKEELQDVQMYRRITLNEDFQEPGGQ